MAKSSRVQRARQLREQATETEAALWQLLRAKQVCGLRFRRQHPIGPYFADFACVSEQLVVEIDGGYHEQTVESDEQRQEFLEQRGWHVLRLQNEDVQAGLESIGRLIADELGLDYEFVKRKATNSGMFKKRKKEK